MLDPNGQEGPYGQGALHSGARLAEQQARRLPRLFTDGSSLLSALKPNLPVTNPSFAHLRLHIEDLPDEAPAHSPAELESLCQAFEQATGWQLRYESAPAGLGEAWSTTIDGGNGQSAGRLVLAGQAAYRGDPNATALIELQQARPLALAIGGLLGEIQRWRHALWQREAELAAGVPVAVRPNDEPHLAARLEAVLQGGAAAVGCQATGLYLLDETTSELKLRASVGLHKDRLLAPARPLRGAMADLEALVGHAVVLEDTALMPHWRCPEEFPAAVCVPVSSPSIPLGTLWMFCDRVRDFLPQETNLIEIIAGRLAAELEREMLLAAGAEGKSRDRQFEAAARWMSERLPSVAPLLDDYDLAGWTRQGSGLGGDFHDWSVLPDGRVALAVGDASGRLLEGALEAAALHAGLKAHAGYQHQSAELLTRLNETLLAAAPGEQRAALAYGLLDPDLGQLELALAGDCWAILARPEERCIITTDSPPLGQTADASFLCDPSQLQPGEALVLLSGGVRRALDLAGLRIGEAALGAVVGRHLRDSAGGILARLRRLLDHGEQLPEDLTVLVLKRRRR
jgi:phosphoserine phosphatase RsbU/P